MSSSTSSRTTSRVELSDFLKSRRARISPQTVGLPHGRRRLTPGLRREEVADLAGVGLTWYTWLEQGRDIRVSAEVLAGIARALRLEPAERAHLLRLAGHTPPVQESVAELLSPRLQRLLDSWEPYPAHITGRRWDLVGWNRTSDYINSWSQLPESRQNILWYMFLLPSARKLMPDWELEVPGSVAALRAEAGRDLGDPDYQLLIKELIDGSLEFAELWARQDVRGHQAGTKRIDHPELGRLELEYTAVQVVEQPSLRLYLFAPANDETDKKLHERSAGARHGRLGVRIPDRPR
jgi:transcriptional regulator with XRE-family HTH domain